MLWSGVCHTDAYTLSGADPEGLFPCVLGHEGAGVVESLGSGVKTLQVGDLVIPLFTPDCGQCKLCKSGKTNLCSSVRETQGRGVMPDGSSRLHCQGKDLYHYMGCSTFSQYTVHPEVSLAKIPADSPPDRCCLLGCGVTTGFGAARSNVTKDSIVAVFGLGGVGLSVVQGAKLRGAKRIIGIDTNTDKFVLARQLGVTDCVNPLDLAKDESIQQVIQSMTDGGVDYSFECIGDTKMMRAALECCHKGWGVSVIIGVAPAGTEICTRPFQLITGRTWKGSAFGDVKGRSELPQLVQMYKEGQLKIDELITHRLPLDKINDAFDMMRKGKCVRTVVNLQTEQSL